MTFLFIVFNIFILLCIFYSKDFLLMLILFNLNDSKDKLLIPISGYLLSNIFVSHGCTKQLLIKCAIGIKKDCLRKSLVTDWKTRK